MRYGYACISMQLSYPQKYGGKEKGVQPITTGRSMIREHSTPKVWITRVKLLWLMLET